jgi:AsmA protein
MNTWLKYGLLAAAALVLLLVAGAVIFVSTFDPNAHKARITEAVKKATGRDLTVSGQIKISVFPWLGAEVGGVSLSNAPGFGDAPMLQVGSAQVRLKLLPLLTGSVELGRVTLDGLSVNLARHKDGVTNWDDLTGKGEAAKGAAPSGAAEPAKPSEGGGLKLAVGGLDVKNANVVWDDAKEGKRYALRDVNINTGAIGGGDPFDFELSFGLDSKEPELSTRNNLSGRASLDFDAGRYLVKPFKLTVEAQGKAVPGGKASLGLSASEALADLKAQKASLDGLSLTAYNLKVTGQAEAEKILDGPLAKGSLEIAAFNVKELLQALGRKALETADPQALTQVSASLAFRTGPDRVDLTRALVKLDKTTLDATASIQNFAKPFYTAVAKVDEIDVDRYLPPKKTGGGASASSSSSGGEGQAAGGKASDEVIPVQVIRDLGLDAKLDVAALKIAGLRLTSVDVRVLCKDGLLRIDPDRLALYGGTLSAPASVDCRGAQPESAVRLDLSKVQLGPLLKDMTGKDSYGGDLFLTADLKTSGATTAAMKRGLNGPMSLKVLDGVFPGVNLENLIKAVAAAGSRSGTVQGKSSDRTNFGEITATAQAAGGVISNKDLLIKSPNLRAEGEGQVNLPADSIDYLVRAKLMASGSGDDSLLGLLVPVRVKGSLSDPSYSVDLAEYLKGAATGLVKGVGGAVQGVGSAIGGVLGGQKKETQQDGTTTKSGTDATKKDQKKGGVLDGLKKIF